MTESKKLIPFPGGDLSSLPDELIPSIRVDTPELLELRRKQAERKRRAKAEGKQEGKFSLGLFPLSWIRACQLAHPAALAVALGIHAYQKMNKAPAKVSNTLGEEVGIDRRARRRALVALEAAGLVQVERQLGRAPLATLTLPAQRR